MRYQPICLIKASILKSNLFELNQFIQQFAKIWISRCSLAHLWPAVSLSQLPCSVVIFCINRNNQSNFDFTKKAEYLQRKRVFLPQYCNEFHETFQAMLNTIFSGVVPAAKWPKLKARKGGGILVELNNACL